MIPRYIFIGVLALLAFGIFLLPNQLTRQPIQAQNQSQQLLQAAKIPNAVPQPGISAHSALVIDATTGQELYQKNPDLKHLPASTTKLVTAMVALEKCSPETVLKVQSLEKEGTLMGLEIEDEVTVENLLFGMLIASGNDAAYVLSANCADSYSDFIAQMNQKAQDLNMENSHFVNPAGFDSPYQYSTARDLAKIAKVAITNPLIEKIVNTKSTVVTDVSGTKTYYLENVNKLLGNIEGLQGVKTGQTEGALEIVITKTTRNRHSIICAVVGSKDRFGETKTLIDWTFKNYQWQNLN